MNASTERFHYRREKKISIAFEGKAEEFLLRAPSARDNETAMSEAQDIQKGIVKRLKDATETMRDIYLLQELELLQEALVGENTINFGKRLRALSRLIQRTVRVN